MAAQGDEPGGLMAINPELLTPMKHIIVGLAGYKTSGKDTTANITRDRLANVGDPVFHYAFADAVRMMCHRVFPEVGRDIWWDDSLKDNPEIEDLHAKSPRHWMRQIAQAVRAQDKNFWADQVIQQINDNIDRAWQSESSPHVAYHFIKDLRFEEDWTPVLRRVRLANDKPTMAWTRMHAVIWWVERGLQTDGHASEDFTWLGRYDDHVYRVNNTGSLAALTDEIAQVLHITNRIMVK